MEAPEGGERFRTASGDLRIYALVSFFAKRKKSCSPCLYCNLIQKGIMAWRYLCLIDRKNRIFGLATSFCSTTIKPAVSALVGSFCACV